MTFSVGLPFSVLEFALVVGMVDLIEVKETLSKVDAVGIVLVKSLEDLMKMAHTFGEPFIFKKGKKDYFFFHDNVCYRYKE